jgi:photosystem II stability/assembly factor-like uncharacterized protein
LIWGGGEVFFVDDKNGWAVVGLGFIFHTNNGGKTWTNQLFTGALSYGLSRIAFVDQTKGCATGSSILCTEDGGKTWTEKIGIEPGSRKRIHNFVVQLQRISFSGPSIGWSVGNDGQIWKTEDSGRTWKLASRHDECGWRVFFVNKKTGWFFGSNNPYICRTDDGGDTSVMRHK